MEETKEKLDGRAVSLKLAMSLLFAVVMIICCVSCISAMIMFLTESVDALEESYLDFLMVSANESVGRHMYSTSLKAEYLVNKWLRDADTAGTDLDYWRTDFVESLNYGAIQTLSVCFSEGSFLEYSMKGDMLFSESQKDNITESCQWTATETTYLHHRCLNNTATTECTMRGGGVHWITSSNPPGVQMISPFKSGDISGELAFWVSMDNLSKFLSRLVEKSVNPLRVSILHDEDNVVLASSHPMASVPVKKDEMFTRQMNLNDLVFMISHETSDILSGVSSSVEVSLGVSAIILVAGAIVVFFVTNLALLGLDDVSCQLRAISFLRANQETCGRYSMFREIYQLQWACEMLTIHFKLASMYLPDTVKTEQHLEQPDVVRTDNTQVVQLKPLAYKKVSIVCVKSMKLQSFLTDAKPISPDSFEARHKLWFVAVMEECREAGGVLHRNTETMLIIKFVNEGHRRKAGDLVTRLVSRWKDANESVVGAATGFAFVGNLGSADIRHPVIQGKVVGTAEKLMNLCPNLASRALVTDRIGKYCTVARAVDLVSIEAGAPPQLVYDVSPPASLESPLWPPSVVKEAYERLWVSLTESSICTLVDLIADDIDAHNPVALNLVARLEACPSHHQYMTTLSQGLTATML